MSRHSPVTPVLVRDRFPTHWSILLERGDDMTDTIHDNFDLGRRRFLQTSVIGGAVTSLAGLLRAESAAGRSASPKRVLFVHLDGGPPQLDMIDLKPEAPIEIRGEFTPIETSVPCRASPFVNTCPSWRASRTESPSFDRWSVRPVLTMPFNASRGLRPRTCNRSVDDRPSVRWSRSCEVRPPMRRLHPWT